MAFLSLTRGYIAVVDDEDLDYLKQWSWYAHKTKYMVYAMRGKRLPGGKQTSRMLHHEVLRLDKSLPKGYVVDHKNRDPLDCRKSNLRICTVAENNRNCRPRRNKKTSKYKGVCWRKDRKKWQVVICHQGVRYCQGQFKHELAAVNAYNQAAWKYHARFAFLNLWDGPSSWEGDPDLAPPPMMPRLFAWLKSKDLDVDHTGRNRRRFSPYDIDKPPGTQLQFDFM